MAARTLRRTLGQERSLRAGIWLVPLMGVVASIGLSFATIAIDRAADYELVPTRLTGTPAGAQAILTAIATSMVTLTTLVLTLVTLAIQLAMGNFPPASSAPSCGTSRASSRSASSAGPSSTPCSPCGRSTPHRAPTPARFPG